MPEVWISTAADPEYQSSVDSALIERAAVLSLRNGLAHESTNPVRKLVASRAAVEMSVLVTSDENMQTLNCEYRGVDAPTDVLSFSLLEDIDVNEALEPSTMPLQLGDVVLAYPYLERQANELGHDVPKEMAWLTAHGTFQLLGYHHSNEVEAAEMEALEAAVLRELGLGGADGE